MSVAQGTLFVERSSVEARNRLATLMLQGGQFAAALAVLSGSAEADNSKNMPISLHLQAVARSLGGKEVGHTALREIQKSIMISPGNIRHWKGLAFVRAKYRNE